MRMTFFAIDELVEFLILTIDTFGVRIYLIDTHCIKHLLKTQGLLLTYYILTPLYQILKFCIPYLG